MITEKEFLESIDNLAFYVSRNLALTRRLDGKILRAYERRLQKQLAVLWKKQMSYIIEGMKDLPSFSENALRVSTNGADDQIDEFMRKLPEQASIAETVVAMMRLAIGKGMKRIIQKLKLGEFGVDFNLQNPDAIRFLGGKLSHELSQAFGTIHASTVGKISSILKDAARTGASYNETAQLIREQGNAGVFSRARAEMIAVREVGIGYEEGNAIPIREFNLKNPDRFVLKFWRTVGDARVTPPHRQNEDDGWIAYESTFSGTGDKHAPGSDNPRCRCATEYKIAPPN